VTQQLLDCADVVAILQHFGWYRNNSAANAWFCVEALTFASLAKLDR
jgi:hypothetical protein